jgi:hypothetical protein
VHRAIPERSTRQSREAAIADLVAVAVDRDLQPIDLDRDDDHPLPGAARLRPQGLAAVGKTLAVEEPGDSIGGRCDRRTALAVGASFRLVLKVHVPAPPEQDQSDVESQGGACDLKTRAELASPLQLAEESTAVPDQQCDGGDQRAEHNAIALHGQLRLIGAEQERADLPHGIGDYRSSINKLLS